MMDYLNYYGHIFYHYGTSSMPVAKKVTPTEPSELTAEEANYGKKPAILFFEVVVGHAAGNALSCGHRTLTKMTCWKPSNLEKAHPILKDMERDQAYWARKRMLTVMQNYHKGMTYIFSDAEILGGGNNLAKWVKEQKLGDITQHGPVKNPNSSNMISFWCWTYNHKEPNSYETAK